MIKLGLSKREKEKRKQKRRKAKWLETHKIISGTDHKLCSICQEYCPSTKEYFYKNKHNNIDGLFPYCKECNRKKTLQWEKDNLERAKRNHKEWRKNNLEYKHKGDRLWYRQNKIDRQQYQKEWQENNRDKTRKYTYSRLLNKSHKITKAELKKLYEYANYSCMYCGMSEKYHKHVYGQRLHKDHAINDGSDGIENCVLACKECNSSKHVKDWNEWFSQDNPIFDKEKHGKIESWLDGFL